MKATYLLSALLLPSSVAFAPATIPCRTSSLPSTRRPSRVALAAAAEDPPPSGIATAAASAGLVANPVMWISLWCVSATGRGLPEGPFGLLGALEGVSYLVVVGFVGASLYKKASTGAGLPAGPNGLLGAAEGLSFLSVVVGLGVLAKLAGQSACVPNALPLLDYSDVLPVCR